MSQHSRRGIHRRWQLMFNILRDVNRVRKVAGFEQISSSAIWLKRRIVKPFANLPPEHLGSELSSSSKGFRASWQV